MASLRINAYGNIKNVLPNYVSIKKGIWDQNQYVVQNNNDLIEDIQTILSIEEFPGNMYLSNYEYHKKLIFRHNNIDPKYKLFTDVVHFSDCNFKNITIDHMHVRCGHFKNCNLENSLFNKGWFHDFEFYKCNLKNSTFRDASAQGVTGYVSFTKCNLNNSRLEFTNRYLNCTDTLSFNDCQMENVDMSGSKFRHNKP